jgi:CheY-like chemotaxis protein
LHDVELHSFRLALHWAGTFWPKSTNQQLRSLALIFDKVILIPTKAGSMGDKILVVDDELLIRDVLTEHLTGQGYEVMQASSGEEAIGLARAPKFHVILMDMGMSGLDGMETYRRPKAEEITRHIPMIMMTEFSYDKEAVAEADIIEVLQSAL